MEVFATQRIFVQSKPLTRQNLLTYVQANFVQHWFEKICNIIFIFHPFLFYIITNHPNECFNKSNFIFFLSNHSPSHIHHTSNKPLCNHICLLHNINSGYWLVVRQTITISIKNYMLGSSYTRSLTQTDYTKSRKKKRIK